MTLTLAGAIAIAFSTASCDNVQGGADDYTGTWTGSASFTSTGFNTPCNWIGRLFGPPAVTLVLNQSGDNVSGTVEIDIRIGDTVDLDPNDGFDCLPLQGTSNIVFVSITPANQLTFRDQFATPGNIWVVTRTTDTIDGNVSNDDAPVGTGLRTITSLSLGCFPFDAC